MNALPLIGARCDACGGWVSRRCPCGGNPGASIEEHARWATAVDRATSHKPSKFEAPPRRTP
jgi:hypothetical protein